MQTMTLTTINFFLLVVTKRFNFNIVRKLSDFISAIYNGEISLKEAETKQRDLDKKIEELKFDYRPENPEEKEKINTVLMQANDMLEYRDKIIKTFRNGTFSSEHLKKSDDAAYDYTLKGVNSFIEEIESMAEKINLGLFEDIFELLLVDYAKYLINLKNTEENKEFVTETGNRISDLKDGIQERSEKK